MCKYFTVWFIFSDRLNALKHYVAIHDNLDKFFVRFPLGDQLNQFDPYLCALPNRVKDIDLDLSRVQSHMEDKN